MLTTTKLYFGQITPDLSAKELTAITQKMGVFLDDMIQDVRSISQNLRPVVLEKLGLIEAIQSLVQVISDTGSIEIVFANNASRLIAKSNELNLYRILQELITNTLKHANASEIRVKLANDKENLILLYEDDGKGFEPKNLIAIKGLGLKNIESRLSVLNGEINFLRTDRGIKVKIICPLE